MKNRPKIKPEINTVDILVEFSGWMLLVLLWGIIFFNYSALPESIPVHYNLKGQPDRFGSRNSIFGIPIIATVIFSGLTLLNRYPHIFNYPVTITEANARKHYTTATRMLRYLKLVILIVFTLMTFNTIQIATERSGAVGTWVFPLTLGLIIITVPFFVIQFFRNNRNSKTQ